MFAAIRHKIQFHEFDTGSAYGVLVHSVQDTIIVLRFWKEIATKTLITSWTFVPARPNRRAFVAAPCCIPLYKTAMK
jgi:hypothetical protein